MTGRATALACSFALLALPACETHAEGLVDALVQRFAASEIEFLRGKTNAPFVPVAWVSATTYEKSRFYLPNGTATDLKYEETSISEGAFLPVAIGRRDALIIGEWVSHTRFRLKDTNERNINVLSVAVPIGWARQVAADWQGAAFVAPLGHRSDAGWYWETLGGVFARYMRSERVSWIFGAYFDVSPVEDFYTPYLGANWILNERWTVSAVLPWPGISYAPSTETYFRLGMAPAGASWQLEAGDRRPHVSLSAWNFGLSAERRAFGNVWLGIEAGVSALRGFAFAGDKWQPPEKSVDRTPYALLSIRLRPAASGAHSSSLGNELEVIR